MVDENINNNDAIITALNYMGCKDIAYTDNWAQTLQYYPIELNNCLRRRSMIIRISYECIGDQLWKMQLQGRLR